MSKWEERAWAVLFTLAIANIIVALWLWLSHAVAEGLRP